MKILTSSNLSVPLASLVALLALPSLGGPYSSARMTSQSPPTSVSFGPSDPHNAGLDPIDQPGGPLVAGMNGTGRGTWRGVEDGLGRLRAELIVSPRGSQYLIDAWLARIVPIGPQEPRIEGTLYGEMCAVNPLDGPQPLAIVLGHWSQEPDGSGSFVAQILVPPWDPDFALVPIGIVAGTFRTPPPDSGRPETGPASLRWWISG